MWARVRGVQSSLWSLLGFAKPAFHTHAVKGSIDINHLNAVIYFSALNDTRKNIKIKQLFGPFNMGTVVLCIYERCALKTNGS